MSFQLDRGLFQFDFTDRHAILGVSVNAEEMNIRERYQMVARSLHPDSGKWKTETDRKLAVKIFSRFVTHAYGQLSRSSKLQEQTIMLELLGKRLVEQNSQLQIVDPLCQELYQTGSDFELVYERLLATMVAAQYVELDQSEQIINQISELNMVYLLRRQLQSIRSTPPSALTSASAGAAKENTSGDIAKTSAIESALRRAEERMNKKNWVQAVQELRDAINLEPGNAHAHALLGLVHLRQQQLTMARISINKAVQIAPKDPQVIRAKQEFDRSSNINQAVSSSKTASKKANEGIFGGLFNRK